MYICPPSCAHLNHLSTKNVDPLPHLHPRQHNRLLHPLVRLVLHSQAILDHSDAENVRRHRTASDVRADVIQITCSSGCQRRNYFAVHGQHGAGGGTAGRGDGEEGVWACGACVYAVGAGEQ